MSHDRYDYGATHDDDIDMSQPPRAPTPFQTTRTCNMVASVYRYTDEVPPMTLDRGTLARIDRAILAAFARDRVTQLVKVPFSWRGPRKLQGMPVPESAALAGNLSLSPTALSGPCRSLWSGCDPVPVVRGSEAGSAAAPIEVRPRS